jgi:hypothetical protein
MPYLKPKTKAKRKIVNAIAAEVLKDPLAPQRVIAERAGVSVRTVERRNSDVAEIVGKNDRIIQLTNKDWEIQALIQKVKLERLNNHKDKINNKDLNQWDRQAMVRYSTLRGSATDEDGGLNRPYQDMSIEELRGQLKAIEE